MLQVVSGLAALAFAGLMIGAITTQIVVFDGELVQIPAVFLVLVAVVAWGRRDRTAQLIALLTRTSSDR